LQYQKPVMVQQQKLKMSPQLYQSIQLMAMPLQDLVLKIKEEVDRNPALEIVKEAGESVDKTPETSGEKIVDFDPFENSSDPGYIGSSKSYSSGEDSKRQFLEGAISREDSLRDHLLWQLRVAPLTKNEFEIGELLINNLDSDGFHLESPSLLVKEAFYAPLEKVKKVIHTFDPVGTCTENYTDSLLVQAHLAGDEPFKTDDVIKNHLALLDKGKFSEISRQINSSVRQVEKITEFIKTLNPFPGRQFSNEKPAFVIPDLQVKEKEGEFVVIINDEEIPTIDVNQFFFELMDGDSTEKEVKRFVNTRVKDARWFIRTVNQRNQTLVKVMSAIVEFQRDFFRKGVKYLVPLTLKDIAGEVGVHEATISRLTNGKYVQTEWGIYELKFFFSNSISGSGSGGSRFSKVGVKEVVREIIEENKGKKKLSDQKIADLLSRKGIKIARRTVAKYRKELDIASSFER